MADISTRGRLAVAADLIERELWFNRHNPFQKAWLAGLLASALLAGSLALGRRWLPAGRALYLPGVLVYFGCPVCSAQTPEQGRPPRRDPPVAGPHSGRPPLLGDQVTVSLLTTEVEIPPRTVGDARGRRRAA